MLGSQIQSPNLISQVSAQKVTRPAGFYQSIVLEFLTVGAAVGVGYLFRGFLDRQFSFTVLISAVAVLLTLEFLGVILMRTITRRIVVILGETVGILAFFLDTPAETLVALGILLAAFLGWGEISAYRELSNALEIRFFRIVRAYLKKAVTALLIVGIVLYIPHWKIDEAFLSESQFSRVIGWATNILSNFYPDVRLSGTVQAFAESLTLSQLKEDPDFLRLPQAVQEEAHVKAIGRTIESLRRTLAIEFAVEESLMAALYRSMTNLLETWRAAYGGEFLVAWAFAAFFILRSLAVFVYYGIAVVAFLVYQVLIAANVVMVSGETHLREIVQYT